MDVLSKRNRKTFDLGAGEPIEVWNVSRETAGSGMVDWSRYPTIGGEPLVIGRIRDFMKSCGLPCGGRIIVTNGAKQALGAAIAQIVKSRSRRGLDAGAVLTHWGPFWPTLISLADLNGARVVVSDTDFPECADIVTSPNNPDGRAMCQSYDVNGKVIERRYHAYEHLIWDAAYASPAYGWDSFCVPSQVQVYSMAKLFGVPGMRLGWLHTEDDSVADFVEAYVEVQTSGVNQHSQYQGAGMLEYFSRGKRYESFCADVHERLAGNRYMLCEALRLGYMTDEADVGVGMYLFVKVRGIWAKRVLRALAKLDVGYVTGEACGLRKKNLLRFNLAQDQEVVVRLCKELERELR